MRGWKSWGSDENLDEIIKENEPFKSSIKLALKIIWNELLKILT